MIRTTTFFLLYLLSLSACNQMSTEDQVAVWISDHAISFTTVEARNGFDDLRPLQEMIGDARIVALGEPTHGNKEVFHLKHRMIEYLVTEMGFNIFALECPFGEALDVNRYVLDGIGDPEKVLAGIYYWNWDTEEVLEMLKWMRAYNANPSNKKKVKFYGFDPQDPERAARVMFEYLAKVDPKLEKKVKKQLGTLQIPFSLPELNGRRPYIPKEYDSLSLKEIQGVMIAFDSKKDKYIAASSSSEWKWAMQNARQVDMWIAANTDEARNYNKVRDLGQAQNIQWILNHEGDEGKAIVWAHNAHVNNSPRKGYEMMGYHLRQWYGDQLKIFGFFFNRGGFKALDETLPSLGMHDFFVGPAPEGTLEQVMASSGLSMAALDLQQLPDKGPVHDWFNEPQLTRYSWGGFKENESQKYLWPYKLAKEFDVLVFLDSTTPVKHIDTTDFDVVWLLDEKLDEPFNTDFESNDPGEEPVGWITWSRFKRLGVEMITSDEKPYRGKQSVKLHRSKGIPYGEIGPNIVQRIDAKHYRGKTIRFRATARAEVDEPGYAFLRLAIDPNPIESAHDGLPPLFDSLDKYRVDSAEWRVYEIEAEVAENADIISYGIYLRDPGTAWMDSIKIEIVE